MRKYLHRSAAALRKHKREYDKKQLKKMQKQVEISLELIRNQLRLGFDVRTRNFESHALTTQLSTLNLTN